MELSETWHTFMLRKTLLTHRSVSFNFFGTVNATVRHSIIQDTAAALLYINLVSILDNAIEMMMSHDDYERGKKMKNRLEMLNKSGKLIDYGALDAINKRRNEIGHELEVGGDVEELDGAISKVHEQLFGWGLTPELREYELTFTRTQMRDSEDENTAFEYDSIIEVKVENTVRLKLTQTTRVE